MNLDYYKKAIDNHFANFYVPSKGVYLAGGAITSMFSGREINDLDLYFNSRLTLADFIEGNKLDKIHIVSCTDKSITMHIGSNEKSITVQCIYFSYFDTPQQIFDSFDYTVNMGCYSFETKEFYFDDDFFKDLALSKLVFNVNTEYPLVSMLRVNKYLDRGYAISQGEMRKIAFTVAKLDLSTKEQFIKHIGGMYSSEALLTVMLWPDDKEFNSDEALEIVSKNLETTPTLNIKGRNNFQPVIKLDGIPPKYIVDYLKDDPEDGGWQALKKQVYTMGHDKMNCMKDESIRSHVEALVLYSHEPSENKLEQIRYKRSKTYHDFVYLTKEFALVHMMLFPDNYDPLLFTMVNMINAGSGFVTSKDKDNLDFIDF